jgi:hypothetical protein
MTHVVRRFDGRRAKCAQMLLWQSTGDGSSMTPYGYD